MVYMVVGYQYKGNVLYINSVFLQALLYGSWANACINQESPVIVAYVVAVAVAAAAEAEAAANPPAPPAPTTEELLAEIRDLLKNQ